MIQKASQVILVPQDDCHEFGLSKMQEIHTDQYFQDVLRDQLGFIVTLQTYLTLNADTSLFDNILN